MSSDALAESGAKISNSGDSEPPRPAADRAAEREQKARQRALRQRIVAQVRQEIATLRIVGSLSGRSLDRALGWPRGTWGRIEGDRDGGRSLPAEQLLEIEAYFDLAPGTLLQRASATVLRSASWPSGRAIAQPATEAA